jgi:hypothetical protein
MESSFISPRSPSVSPAPISPTGVMTLADCAGWQVVESEAATSTGCCDGSSDSDESAEVSEFIIILFLANAYLDGKL